MAIRIRLTALLIADGEVLVADGDKTVADGPPIRFDGDEIEAETLWHIGDEQF